MTDVRSDLGKALTGKLTETQIKTLIDEVLAITKKARCEFNCKKCGQLQIQYAEVTDTKNVTSALVDLANQAWGKPTDVKEEDGVSVEYRVVIGVDEGQ